MKDERFVFRLEPARYKVLRWQAELQQIPMADVVRNAVGEKYDWDNPRVQQRADYFFADRAKLTRQHAENDRHERRNGPNGAERGAADG